MCVPPLSVVPTQNNNQPPMLGQMALACDVINNVTSTGGSAMEALAAVEYYFFSDGTAEWCRSYEYAPLGTIVPADEASLAVSGYDSFGYQACTQGNPPYTHMLPAWGGSVNVLPPEGIATPLELFEADCR